MILRSQQVFDKVYLDLENPSDFIEFISYTTERELVYKLMDELEDHKIHIVELKEPEFRQDFPMIGESTIEQDLVYEKLVQCKNCVRVYPWCAKFKNDFGSTGFCPYGKEIEDE